MNSPALRSESLHAAMTTLADEFERRFRAEQSHDWQWFGADDDL